MKKLIIILLLSIPILGMSQNYLINLTSAADIVGNTITPIKKEYFELRVIKGSKFSKVTINGKYFGRILSTNYRNKNKLGVIMLLSEESEIWKIVIDDENETVSIGQGDSFTMFYIRSVYRY